MISSARRGAVVCLIFFEDFSPIHLVPVPGVVSFVFILEDIVITYGENFDRSFRPIEVVADDILPVRDSFMHIVDTLNVLERYTMERSFFELTV